MLQLFTTKCLTFEIFHSDDATSCFDASDLGRAWGGGKRGGRAGPGAAAQLGRSAVHTTPRAASLDSGFERRSEAYGGEGKHASGLVWVLLAFFLCFSSFSFLISLILLVGGERWQQTRRQRLVFWSCGRDAGGTAQHLRGGSCGRSVFRAAWQVAVGLEELWPCSAARNFC